MTSHHQSLASLIRANKFQKVSSPRSGLLHASSAFTRCVRHQLPPQYNTFIIDTHRLRDTFNNMSFLHGNNWSFFLQRRKIRAEITDKNITQWSTHCRERHHPCLYRSARSGADRRLPKCQCDSQLTKSRMPWHTRLTTSLSTFSATPETLNVAAPVVHLLREKMPCMPRTPKPPCSTLHQSPAPPRTVGTVRLPPTLRTWPFCPGELATVRLR